MGSDQIGPHSLRGFAPGVGHIGVYETQETFTVYNVGKIIY